MTILERWLKRFRDGAASAYTWEVHWHLAEGGPRRQLRAKLPVPLLTPAEACPLVMQELLDGFCSPLGKDMLRIIAVADGDPQADPALRQEIYALCGIEETPPFHTDGAPCMCHPGTAGWVQHHGMAPSETGLSQAFYDALGLDEEER
jgi:hypothetical protein